MDQALDSGPVVGTPDPPPDPGQAGSNRPARSSRTGFEGRKGDRFHWRSALNAPSMRRALLFVEAVDALKVPTAESGWPLAEFR